MELSPNEEKVLREAHERKGINVAAIKGIKKYHAWEAAEKLKELDLVKTKEVPDNKFGDDLMVWLTPKGERMIELLNRPTSKVVREEVKKLIPPKPSKWSRVWSKPPSRGIQAIRAIIALMVLLTALGLIGYCG